MSNEPVDQENVEEEHDRSMMEYKFTFKEENAAIQTGHTETSPNFDTYEEALTAWKKLPAGPRKVTSIVEIGVRKPDNA